MNYRFESVTLDVDMFFKFTLIDSGPLGTVDVDGATANGSWYVDFRWLVWPSEYCGK